MPLHIATYTPESFHAGVIPIVGEQPIIVEGLNTEGLEVVEEDIVHHLAQRPDGSTPKQYDAPDFPITLFLRGQRVNTTGDAVLREPRFRPIMGAPLAEGRAVVDRESDRVIRVNWQADVCFAGVGTVADSRAAARYSRAVRGGTPKVSREVSVRDSSITFNDTYKEWTRRNGIEIKKGK